MKKRNGTPVGKLLSLIPNLGRITATCIALLLGSLQAQAESPRTLIFTDNPREALDTSENSWAQNAYINGKSIAQWHADCPEILAVKAGPSEFKLPDNKLLLDMAPLIAPTACKQAGLSRTRVAGDADTGGSHTKGPSSRVSILPSCIVGTAPPQGEDQEQLRKSWSKAAGDVYFKARDSFVGWATSSSQVGSGKKERPLQIGFSIGYGITRTDTNINIWDIAAFVALYEATKVFAPNLTEKAFEETLKIRKAFWQTTAEAAIRVSYKILFIEGRIGTSPTGFAKVGTLASDFAKSVKVGLQIPPIALFGEAEGPLSNISAQGSVHVGFEKDNNWDQTLLAIVGNDNAREQMSKFFNPHQPIGPATAYTIGADINIGYHFELSARRIAQAGGKQQKVEGGIFLTLEGLKRMTPPSFLKKLPGVVNPSTNGPSRFGLKITSVFYF